MAKQYQLCLKWPDRGLAHDAVRLASIEEEEWDALQRHVEANAARFPLLSGALSAGATIEVHHSRVADLAREVDAGISYEDVHLPEQSALLTLSLFLSQALGQRQASIAIECRPDV